MGLGETLNKQMMSWVGLAITIVIGSIVLLKFKSIGDVGTCTSNFLYNTTSFLCYNSSNTSETATATGLPVTINTFVTAISEPANWVAIVIIAVIGFAVLKIFSKNK